MVEALEAVGIPAALAAHLGAAVGAGVEQRAHHAVLAAHEHDAPQPELAHAEVPRLAHLRLVTEVEPRAFEDARALLLEHLGVEERLALYAEQTVANVVIDVAIAEHPHSSLAGSHAQ